MKQIKELKAMPLPERNNKLSELKKELMQARAQIATGTSPKNPGRVRAIKRTIARIYTLAQLKEEPKKA